MKILVCIGNVPDTTTRIKFTDGLKKLDTTGIQWVINPWDELSLTRALELKDENPGVVTSVTVAHVGTIGAEPTIRKALAIGADDAIRINSEPIDSFQVASELSAALRGDGYDLILCGIESSDYNGANVGGMLAELLGLDSVSSISSVKIENGQFTMTREIDGGREIIRVNAPVVAVIQKGIAKEPRIAAMRGIMMARTKPLKVVEPSGAEPLTSLPVYELPKPRAACRFIDPENPGQLIELLQNEAKII
jgi:electron transfer flavoprotein beta subunit